MWLVDQISFRARDLDFSSSGQRRCHTLAVVADGVELINALDLVELDREPVQVMVCEQCGTTGCSDGGYVALRRLDDGLLMIPPFSAMLAPPEARHRYAPPAFIAKKGAPFLQASVLEAFCDRAPELADAGRWPQMSWLELKQLLQWEAPMRVLGRFPGAPRLDPQRVAAASHGGELEVVGALNALLCENRERSLPLALAAGEPVTFYLNEEGLPEWQPLTVDARGYHLAIAPGLGVLG